MIFLLVTLLGFSFADQSASWTCQGDKYLIEMVTPYVGDEGRTLGLEKTYVTVVDLDKSASNYEAARDSFIIYSDIATGNSQTLEGSDPSGDTIIKLVVTNIRRIDDGMVFDSVGTGNLVELKGQNLRGKEKNLRCRLQ